MQRPFSPPPLDGTLHTLVSVRLLSFYFEGSKLVRCLVKTDHTLRTFLYFENRHNTESNHLKLNCNYQKMFTGTNILNENQS